MFFSEKLEERRAATLAASIALTHATIVLIEYFSYILHNASKSGSTHTWLSGLDFSISRVEKSVIQLSARALNSLLHLLHLPLRSISSRSETVSRRQSTPAWKSRSSELWNPQ